MVDGSLSQEEIDLLLQGADDFSGSAPDSGGGVSAEAIGQDLSPLERETVADIVLHALNAGTQGLGLILSRNVKLGNPYPEVKAQDAIQSEFDSGHVVFTQKLSGAINGAIGLFLPSADAGRLAGIVMGSEGAPGSELDSAQIATVKDAIGPMLFNLATQISVRVGAAITPMPVDVRSTDDSDFPLTDGGQYLKIQIPFVIEGSIDSRLNMVMPLGMAMEIYNKSRQQGQPAMAGQPQGGMPGMGQPTGPQPGQTGIQDVGFPSLSTGASGPLQPNMNLLMDVQMTLTVELGRTKMYIKEILGLGEGSIIELDKLAGEPVDMLVNGKLIAKGEVVVIDENFGVRVTDIVSPIDRLKTQKQE
ncbi:MAG: flagellar motor switch protein FliN [Spirochaetales bacterium]|nr:flagellar motor switch protein FliN [Leptospiraceae bacterium]MCP5483214.1 flagellar motor switch protein FliN [Spirochaetales bacterium]MCP5486718.1 flagellar motor switch protein FliN [Spirochaetales bacterium]